MRRQFEVAEGDPFNPREIRESGRAHPRARLLRHGRRATRAKAQRREQVIVDVNVEEQPTGSLSFGGDLFHQSRLRRGDLASRERNFLGRGQRLSFGISTASYNRAIQLQLRRAGLPRPRPVAFGLDARAMPRQTISSSRLRHGASGSSSRRSTFPVSENGRLQAALRPALQRPAIVERSAEVGDVITAEAGAGRAMTASLGYTYSYDTRRTGLDPEFRRPAGVRPGFRRSRRRASYVKTTARAIAPDQRPERGSDAARHARGRGAQLLGRRQPR